MTILIKESEITSRSGGKIALADIWENIIDSQIPDVIESPTKLFGPYVPKISKIVLAEKANKKFNKDMFMGEYLSKDVIIAALLKIKELE